MLVLKKTVKVHDPEQYPTGGPLVTLAKGTPKDAIPAAMLAQLCDDHFVETGE